MMMNENNYILFITKNIIIIDKNYYENTKFNYFYFLINEIIKKYFIKSILFFILHIFLYNLCINIQKILIKLVFYEKNGLIVSIF